MNKSTKAQKDFSKSILKRIKKEKIKQVPKEFFVLKNIIIWLLLCLSIVIGAISLSISYDYLMGADWTLLSRIGIFKIIAVFLPIFWVVFLLISAYVAYLNFKNTKKGYKFSFIKILFLNITGSIGLAIVLFLSGASSYIESRLEQCIPDYRNVLVEDKVTRMLQVWQNEDDGLLIGEIISVEDSVLIFIDSNKKEWTINIEKGTTLIKPRVNISVGEKIKIIGTKFDSSSFSAEEIRPFLGQNNNSSRNHEPREKKHGVHQK